ncbi:MAG: signal peptidase II [Firmicutes bacterium]|nr:signal peptidase II [Bacillota bacterium]
MKQLAVGLVILFLDQFSKLYISTNFVEGESIPLIKSVIYLTYVNNPGAAFGLFAYKRWLLILVGVGALVATWIFRHQIAKQSKLTRWGITLAISGAFGNLIDRLRLGKVIDFIDLRFWPIFNIADIAIVCGIALLFWEVLRDGRKA